MFLASRKGLHPFPHGTLRLFGLPSKLQVSIKPQVQWVPGPHQHREQSCPLSQLGAAKSNAPVRFTDNRKTIWRETQRQSNASWTLTAFHPSFDLCYFYERVAGLSKKEKKNSWSTALLHSHIVTYTSTVNCQPGVVVVRIHIWR